MTPSDIIRVFDGLDAGEVGLFMCDNSVGSIGAHIKGVSIKGAHTLRSLTGYGDSVEEAISDLWDHVTALDPMECILIEGAPDDRRGVIWNGYTWKPYPLPPRPSLPLPNQKEKGL